jgi:diguanylate cyclase (GGDEF)-like protein
LLDFGLDLFQNMDAGAPLKKLLPWAERLAETEHAALWCFECDGPQLVLKEAAGKLTDFPVDKLKTGEDLAWKVWKSGQSLFVPDLTVWKDASAWTRKSGLQGALGVPLKSGNQTVYVLAVYYEGLSPALVEPRMGLLELMAQAAFENESILQKIDQLSHSLQTQEQSTAVLQLQARLEHAISMLAAQFINMDAKKIRDAIRLALKTMARTAGVDRAFLAVLPNGVHSRLVDIDLFSATSDPATSTLTYGSGEFLLQPDFRWALEKLNQLEAAYISDANQLPNADKDALPYLRAKQLVGFAAVPLENNRNMTGILGFESHQQALHWPPELLGVLKVAADLFSNLLERQTHLQNEQAERQKMVQQVKQLEQRTHEHALISEMGDLLQACRTADEAYPIIHRYLQRLLPEKSGALYIFQDANDPAEKAVSWGIAAPSESEHELTTNECWALRRGRMYLIKDPQVETLCGHIKEKIQNSYLCVPMLAQGRAIGVLHLRANPGSDQADAFSEDQQRLARRSAEYIAMSLINLRLRDELRSQAIRDPLTGLFNRRYMEETLEREIRRAQRHNTVVSVIMFDIDRMKPINDTFGHDAGDLLLRSLGSALIGMFRGEDVACRYGGDEFTIVLPEASLTDTWRRAEHVRQTVRSLGLKYEGKSLGEVTLSIGVAAYPDHGQTAERVLLSADAASYAAKSEGGDRIMVGRVADQS